jgi:Tetratricopeptide repeat
LWTHCRSRVRAKRGVPESVNQPSVSAPDRQQLLDKAKQDFAAEKWPEAFTEFSELHSQYPADAKISEYLAECTLNTGRTELAKSLMEPIRKASPERWQASALLARAYAGSNRDAERDAEIANQKRLYDAKFAPKIAQLQMFLLERRVLPDGSVRIWYELEPWGKFNTYLFARIYDALGEEIYHIALDSSYLEQAVWAKTHSKEATAGERVFFLDGYSRTQKTPDGTSTVTQALLATFDASC